MKENRTLLYSTLLFLFVLLSGFSFVLWLSDTRLEKAYHSKLNVVVQEIDKILNYAVQTASEVGEYSSSPCNENTLTVIRKIVAGIPYVRSASLFSGGIIHCSSVYGEKEVSYNSGDYYDGMLMMMSNNILTPSRSILIYRSTKKSDKGSLIGIDGHYIYRVLSSVSDDHNVILVIGERFMNSDGEVSQYHHDKDRTKLSSSNFPYSVELKESETDKFLSLLKFSAGSITVIFILSLLIAYCYHRYIVFRLSMDYRLRHAMKNGCIHPVIQPIICPVTRTIIGGEVLLRWALPDGGYISPDIFIPAAEKNGLIKPLTTFAIESVTKQYEQSGVVNPAELIIFFNVSSANFEDGRLLTDCIHASRSLHKLNISIGLEITERTLIEESEGSRYITDSLRKYNVKIALDDFGTGNANYTYIRQFSPHFLKIDKAFTRNITGDPVSKGIIKNMISLADLAGCSTIAEGVEDQEQADELFKLGVHYFQGYLYSKPVLVQQFIDDVHLHLKS